MRKVALISVIIFFVTLLLTVTAWSDENDPCVRNIDGKIACPPQGGTCLKICTAILPVHRRMAVL